VPSGTYRYDVEAIDIDDDPLTYALTTSPVGMSIDAATGLIQWPVAEADIGSHDVAVRVDDGTGLSDDQSWTLEIAPANLAPVVDAGPDQTVVLPERSVTLTGSVTDDGRPLGAALDIVWSQVSGPTEAILSSGGTASTTVTFARTGVYVFRLSANDTELTGFDEVRVSVLPSTGPNAAPVVEATAPAPVVLDLNLLANPDAEEPAQPGETPGWSQASGAWEAVEGAYAGERAFAAPGSALAELRQDVDLSLFAGAIAAGGQALAVDVRFRSGVPAAPDQARVIVEYRDPSNLVAIGRLDSGPIATEADWTRLTDTRSLPVGTGWLRLRLASTRGPGAAAGAVFDALSLRLVPAAGVVLLGSAVDDGLPLGAPVTTTWSLVSGPGPVEFADSHAAATTATLHAPGSYRLRLAAGDTELQGAAEIDVSVGPPNGAPLVEAGPDRLLTLPEDTLRRRTAAGRGARRAVVARRRPLARDVHGPDRSGHPGDLRGGWRVPAARGGERRRSSRRGHARRDGPGAGDQPCAGGGRRARALDHAARAERGSLRKRERRRSAHHRKPDRALDPGERARHGQLRERGGAANDGQLHRGRPLCPAPDRERLRARGVRRDDRQRVPGGSG
jgi:hypothetical protein